jgi:hypothetical protein
MIVIVALGLWPLSHHYTSLGVDLESLEAGGRVRCTFYRLRWPGDGSVCVGRLVEHRAADAKVLERFDLGGRFFKPAKETRPASAWNRWGFWWITSPRTPSASAAGMAPGATEVLMAGVPHWLLVALLTVFAFVVSRKRARTPHGETPALQSPLPTATLGDR